MSIKKLTRSFLFLLVRWSVRLLISLRYKVTVKGLEKITNLKERGTLILPNHPAEIDPVFLAFFFWRKFQPKPLVVEHFYYLKGFQFLMEWVGALPFPNLDMATSKRKVHQIEQLFEQLVADLKAGKTFLVYPSGKLKLSGEEEVGGASFVPNILKAYPQAQVILVRTTGLWGSRFSRGITGKVPDFGETLWEGVKILLKNGIFFTPRRKVLIEVEQAPESFPVGAAKMDVNRWLDAWFNKNGPEPLTLVSDKFWTRSVPQVTASKTGGVAHKVEVSPELEKEVIVQIAQLTHKAPEKISREMQLSADLGLDSLDAAQIAAFLEERFDSVIEHTNVQTVEDVLEVAAGKNKALEPEVAHEELWPKEKKRPPPGQPQGETIIEAFLRSVERMGSHTACADRLSGTLSYRKLKQAALILSLKIRALPGENIGVLLPSSNAAYLVILAILLAKKKPVMLNWTTGVRVLEHVAKTTSLQTVLSSRRFLDRLDNGELGCIEEKLVLLEELRAKISLGQKIKGLLLSFRGPEGLMRTLALAEEKSDDIAAYIFTSGTEALPKGVPLSHRNILSNQSAAIQCVDFKASDILYGVLPPFHSFGFAVTGFLPLLAGLKVFYAPDPTSSRGMANDIFQWKPTLFCCAPSFVRNLLRVASPKALKSLRLFVLGAEKTTEDLYQSIARLCPHASAIEGYGITECSPIITLQRPDELRKGVGRPLPGVSVRIIDVETLEPLPQGAEGEVCIAGPNVFQGYLGGALDPFIELEGRRWYRAGDRGSLDAEGSLSLSGRLKRFVKIGGEMISLGGIEEELNTLATEKGWSSVDAGPSLAVSAKEREGERPLILVYATFDLSKEDANAALKDKGFGRLAKIADVVRVEEIPLTGTGKIHHRRLDEEYGNIINPV